MYVKKYNCTKYSVHCRKHRQFSLFTILHGRKIEIFLSYKNPYLQNLNENLNLVEFSEGTNQCKTLTNYEKHSIYVTNIDTKTFN